MECLWFCDFQFWSHQGSWIWDKRVVGTSITRLDGAIWWSFHVLGPNQQLTKVLLCWIKSWVASIVQSNSGVPAKARARAVRIHGSIHTIKNTITSLNIINLKFTWMKTISQTKTIPFQMEHSYCKNMWNSKESQHFEFGKIESFLFGWKKNQPTFIRWKGGLVLAELGSYSLRTGPISWDEFKIWKRSSCWIFSSFFHHPTGRGRDLLNLPSDFWHAKII